MALIAGRCLCGSVRYEGDAPPENLLLCHCRDCQYVSGGEPAAVVLFPAASIRVVSGTLREHVAQGSSGGSVTRRFCPECGTHLFSRVEALPAMVGVKAGTMDDAAGLAPAAVLWTDTAQPWAHAPAGVHSFPGNPPL